jgi:hypothetical protein
MLARDTPSASIAFPFPAFLDGRLSGSACRRLDPAVLIAAISGDQIAVIATLRLRTPVTVATDRTCPWAAAIRVTRTARICISIIAGLIPLQDAVPALLVDAALVTSVPRIPVPVVALFVVLWT